MAFHCVRSSTGTMGTRHAAQEQQCCQGMLAAGASFCELLVLGWVLLCQRAPPVGTLPDLGIMWIIRLEAMGAIGS